MSTIQPLLNQLICVLLSKNYQICKWFEEGIDSEYIYQISKQNNIILPSEVINLYCYKNGLKEEVLLDNDLGHLWIIPLGIFIPFEDSFKAYLSNVSMSFWDKCLFPLFESGGGEYILIDCDQESNTYKMLFYYSPQVIEIVTIYDSLEKLLISTIGCFDMYIYYYDQQGYFNVDYKKERELLKVLNPNSNYWKNFGG